MGGRARATDPDCGEGAQGCGLIRQMASFRLVMLKSRSLSRGATTSRDARTGSPQASNWLNTKNGDSVKRQFLIGLVNLRFSIRKRAVPRRPREEQYPPVHDGDVREAIHRNRTPRGGDHFLERLLRPFRAQLKHSRRC